MQAFRIGKLLGIEIRVDWSWLFISNIEQEPTSARAEFFIALVGPITSILLGVGFLAASLLAGVSLAHADTAVSGYARLGPLETLLAWLGPINLTIGACNLIPAFPLDRGRVLRSVLWGIAGDLGTSTHRVSADRAEVRLVARRRASR